EIAMQRQALIADLERQLTGQVTVAYHALQLLEGPGAPVLQQAPLNAVGGEGRDGQREEGREPRGIWPLDGHLGCQASALWPLAQGAVKSGARFTQAGGAPHAQRLRA